MNTVLGSVCVWMSQEAVKAHLQSEFQDYPDTQVKHLQGINRHSTTWGSHLYVIPVCRFCQWWGASYRTSIQGWYKGDCSGTFKWRRLHFEAEERMEIDCAVNHHLCVWDCVSVETWYGDNGRQRVSCWWLCAMQSLQTCLPVEERTDVGWWGEGDSPLLSWGSTLSVSSAGWSNTGSLTQSSLFLLQGASTSYTLLLASL